MLIATVLVALAGAFADRAAASGPGPLTLPDLKIIVPTNLISIGTDPSTGDRQLRFTHVTADVGAGPFEIDPTYNSQTGTATFTQAIYRSPSRGNWVLDHRVPVAASGEWHPPSDYQFPLTAFTLNRMAPDGSPGAVLATSPKADYCITGDTMVPGIANTPDQTFISPSNCGDPTAALGWSVGWGDEYDQTDAGQPIDLTGVPNGTYILHAVVDPRHVFTESNTTNDVTDTKLMLSGDNVTVLSQSTPGSAPPAVTLTSPGPGTAVSGAVTLSAVASAHAPAVVSAVQFLLDGRPLGPDLTRPPYTYTWSATGVAFGAHWLSAEVTDSQGSLATATPVAVNLLRPAPIRLRSVRWRRGLLTLSLGPEPRGAVIEATISAPGHPRRTVTVRHGRIRTRTARPPVVRLTMLIGGHQRGGALVLRLAELPVLAISNPVRGETLSGIVPLAATATSGTPIASVRFFVDGRPVGRAIRAAPFALHWDTRRLHHGSHVVSAQAFDLAGHSTVTRVSVNVQNPAPPMTCFVMQADVSTHGQDTAVTGAFRTALPGETLLALVSADGPAAPRQQAAKVTGAGLRWRLVARANRSFGDSEIWTTTALHPLKGARVIASLGQSGFNISLTVVAMEGADGVGAAAARSGISGFASTSLRTLSHTSLIFAVGNDWSQASARRLSPGWVMLDQWLNTGTGDTFWAQTTNHPAGAAGTLVRVTDAGPAGDQWNLAAAELVNSGG